MQSESADLTTLQQNLQERGLIVIESIPDDTIIIRIPIQYNSAITLHELGSMEGVRWAGELPIAWRVSPEVASIAGREAITVDLDISPAPDLSIQELKQLQSDLESISSSENSRDICDSHLCQSKSVNAIWIPILAMDGRILHIHQASKLTIHNSVASDISGIIQELKLLEDVKKYESVLI